MAFKVVFFTFTVVFITLLPMISSFYHLEGIRKGDNVEGVRAIKDYLQRYGYLNYPDSQSDVAVNDIDHFDDELESAIKTYQRFYNLEPTGIMDAETIGLMSTPRCGVPDVPQKHQKNKQLFHILSHYTFINGTPKWPANKSNLSYAFSGTVPAFAKTPISRAFDSWAQNSHFRFIQVSNYSTADVKISFERGDHGDNSPFDGAPMPGKNDVVAHAYPPQYGLLHFDADDSFDDGAFPDKFDVETIAVHEIGHVLGLDHSNDRAAVMFAYVDTNFTKRKLEQDDIDGIQALY